MTKKTKHLGNTPKGGKSSDKYLSPQKPYTGDGEHTRKPHDPVEVEVKHPKKKKKD